MHVTANPIYTLVPSKCFVPHVTVENGFYFSYKFMRIWLSLSLG